MPLLLVTGGAGFIGSQIAVAAIAEGWSVRILDSFREDVHGSAAFTLFGKEGQAELVRGDVRDRAVAADALRGVTAVAHEAGKVGLGVSFGDAADYCDSNVTGTAVLLSEMVTARVRQLVLASSMVVYGEGKYLGPLGPARPSPRAVADLERGIFDPRDAAGNILQPGLVTEDDALEPRNVYALSKLAQEHLVSAWVRASGAVAASLRYHNVFGPGMPADTPYAGVAAIFRSSLARGESPRVFEDGGQRRDFVDVRDVAVANLAALRWLRSQVPGTHQAFNIGSGTVRTVGEFAAQIARAVAGPEPTITGEYRLGDVRHVTASSKRAETELGWKATTPFADSVADFATAPLRGERALPT